MSSQTSDLDLGEISLFLEFIEPMAELVDRIRTQRRRETASEFSPFRYLQTSELGLSRILGDFLSPAGPHCQGDVYLKDFLLRVGLPDADTAGAFVRTEERLHSGRRIDVTVRGPGWICGIENKPFAVDQQNQLQDYWAAIKTEVDAGCARLIYLSGSNSFPSDISLAADAATCLMNGGELFVFSYSGRSDDASIIDFDQILEAWQNLSKPERLRAFISDFRAHLTAQFSEGGTMVDDSASRSFAEELLASDRLARRALTLMELMPEMERLLLQRFFAAIKEAVQKAGAGSVEVISVPERWDRNEYLSFSLIEKEAKSGLWKDYITLSFELTKSGDASWGISWAGEHEGWKQYADALLSEFAEDGSYRERCGDWPVWWDLGLVAGSRLKGGAALRPMHAALCERKFISDLAERVVSVMRRADAALAGAKR